MVTQSLHSLVCRQMHSHVTLDAQLLSWLTARIFSQTLLSLP